MSSTLSTLPAPLIGYIFLAGSALLLALGAHALLFSALYPSRASLGGGCGGSVGEGQWQWKRPIIIIIDIMIAIMNAVLDALARDAHYKYLVLFSVPVCAYFVIANWEKKSVHAVMSLACQMSGIIWFSRAMRRRRGMLG